MSSPASQPGTDGPRVLMTTDAVGGVWSFVMTLAGGLAARGCSVVIATLGPAPSASQRAQAAAIQGLELQVTDLALDWMDKEGRDRARALRTLATLEKRVAPDMVHANGHREVLAEWRAPVLLTSHSCVATWWPACRGSRLPEEWRSYCADVAAALGKADAWVTPSRSLAGAMAAAHGVGRSAEVIANGAAPAAGNASREPFILTAGRLWDEAKGMQTLVDAAAGLAWPVWLAGEERLDGGKATGEGPVRRLGHLPPQEMAGLMGRASIFAAPSVYEPFGLAVLEAAGAGCSLVLSDIPTFRELWAGAADFVPPGDVGALRQALQRLIEQPDRRAYLQRQARIRAARYHSDAMSAAYLNRYHRLHRQHQRMGVAV